MLKIKFKTLSTTGNLFLNNSPIFFNSSEI